MSVSIIIPTWNEAAHIAATIRSLREQTPGEIIVVDGGSTDDTVALAQAADRVLVSAPGRAFQMNAGATVKRTANTYCFCTLIADSKARRHPRDRTDAGPATCRGRMLLDAG